MLYDNMIYFACCVASHGAQYGLFDQCVWQVIIIIFTRVVIIKYCLHAVFFYCNFILLLVVFI